MKAKYIEKKQTPSYTLAEFEAACVSQLVYKATSDVPEAFHETDVMDNLIELQFDITAGITAICGDFPDAHKDKNLLDAVINRVLNDYLSVYSDKTAKKIAKRISYYQSNEKFWEMFANDARDMLEAVKDLEGSKELN